MKQLFLGTLILSFVSSTGWAALYPELRHYKVLITLTLPVARSDDSLVSVQMDTVQSITGRNKIVPRRAAIRSLMLPGWGQLYNRQYWKIPVIYSSLGAAVSIFRWNQQRYSQYMAGYREAYASTAINPLMGTKTAVVRGEEHTVAYLKRATDQYRRQRDLTILLTVVGWVLNAVEAKVAAHLSTFDISDDLTMKITPTVLPTPGLGLLPGARIALRYK